MALYFNVPKNGDTFAALGGSLENVNSMLTFSEARIQKLDDGVYKLCMFLESATDVQNISDKAWTFSPCFAAIVLHSTEYERSKKDGDNWVKIKTQPSPVEVFYCEYFEENADLFLNDEKAFKGKLNLWDSPTTFEALKTGKQPNGQDLPPGAKEYVLSGMIACESTEIDKLKELPAAPTKKSWGGGSKGQTEAERLKERTAQFVAHCNDMELLQNGKFETLSAIHLYFANYSNDAEVRSVTALNILRILMG